MLPFIFPVPKLTMHGCFADSSTGCLMYRLLVRGEDWSCKEAGVNVLVLSDGLDAAGEIAKEFALQESQHAANRLADYLNHIPMGRTVSYVALL